MPAEVVTGPGKAPRRARYLIPTQLPRRGELVAACAVVLLLAHLVFAQLTFVFAVVFVCVSRMSRWRLSWLAAPAAAGVVWTLAIGLGNAAQGFGAGPAHIVGFLSAHGLFHLHGAFTGAGGWLLRQAPLALVAAAAEAGVVGWLDWLHTDEWAVAPPRRGLVAAARRAGVTQSLRSGLVVTRDGGSLGVAPSSGARVGLSWSEAAAGVLFTGAAARDVTATSLQLVHAALRLRKPVIALDLSGDPAMGTALAAACTATGAPLRTFGTGEAGSGCYEPFRDGPAARRTELMLALLGTGTGTGTGGAETALRGVFELIAEVPAGLQVPVLDDVLHLLNPMAMQARLGLVSGTSPLAAQIAERVRDAVRQVQTAPEAVAAAARQLEAVRKSPAGRWLRADGADKAGIDLGHVIRERSAVLFQADSPGMARLVCADLLALGEDLRRISVDGDGVVLLCGCEKIPDHTLARLVESGASAGLAVLATTTSMHAAAELAGAFGTLVIHRLADADARLAHDAVAGTGTAHAPAARLAARTGLRLRPLAPVDTAQPVIAVSAPFAMPAPVRGMAVPSAVATRAARPAAPFTSPSVASSPAGTASPVSAPLVPGAPAAGSTAAGVPPSGPPPWNGSRAGPYGLVPQPAVPVHTLLSLRTAQFVLAVSSPRPRLVELAQTVPARLPRPGTKGSAQ
jgi:hypothetical protein